MDIPELKKLIKLNKDKCLICLEGFKLNCDALYLPCSHLYHKECIVRWFISNDKCPTCKAEYYLGDDDKDDIFDDDDYYFGDIDDDIYLHNEDDDYPYEGRNYINYK